MGTRNANEGTHGYSRVLTGTHGCSRVLTGTHGTHCALLRLPHAAMEAYMPHHAKCFDIGVDITNNPAQA
jgi:hypothetical protein